MFGRKEKPPENEALAMALLKGITEAKVEAAEETARRTDGLCKSYNAASGVIMGLTALHDLPDSGFEFSVSEVKDRVQIDTNIPTIMKKEVTESVNNVTLVIQPDGAITFYGDAQSFKVRDDFYFGIEKEKTKGHNAAEKILRLVAKKATAKGLIP
jgi:hypothetical protein